jgi:hypothetical protein
MYYVNNRLIIIDYYRVKLVFPLFKVYNEFFTFIRIKL